MRRDHYTTLVDDIALDIVELERRLIWLAQSKTPMSDEKAAALQDLLLSLQKARHFLDDDLIAAMTHRRTS